MNTRYLLTLVPILLFPPVFPVSTIHHFIRSIFSLLPYFQSPPFITTSDPFSLSSSLFFLISHLLPAVPSDFTVTSHHTSSSTQSLKGNETPEAETEDQGELLTRLLARFRCTQSIDVQLPIP